jgi:hypothetical protein
MRKKNKYKKNKMNKQKTQKKKKKHVAWKKLEYFPTPFKVLVNI